MADTTNLTNFLQDVADAIKEKKEYSSSQKILAADFDTEIASIETGIDTSDATATADDILAPKTAYINDQKVTGAINKYYSTSYTESVLNTGTNRFCDISSDGKVFAYVSGKTIYVYKVMNGNLTQVFTQATGMQYNATACRIAVSPSSDGKLNIWVCSLGHDPDYNQTGCLRVNLDGDGYPLSAYYYGKHQQLTGWEANNGAIYPHPTRPDVACSVFPCRQTSDKRGYFMRFFKIKDKTLTYCAQTNKYLKTPTAWSGAYDFTLCHWATDNIFYIQDTDLTTNWKIVLNITDEDQVSVSSTASMSTSPTGFKSYTENYKFANKCLYDISGNLLHDFSSNDVGDYSHIHEVDGTLGLSTIYEGYFYLYIINTTTYDLTQVQEPISTNISNPFHSDGSGKLFDKLRFISQYKSSPGNILVFNENAFQFLGYNIHEQNFIDISESDFNSGDLLQDRLAYKENGKVLGTMPNNGPINIAPSDTAQTIPAGYTSGGTVAAISNQIKTITPTTSQQIVIPDTGYNGLGQVNVNAVDNTIDENIVAGNIKKDITILGVTGTLEEGPGGIDETIIEFQNLNDVDVVTENGKNVLVLTNALPYTKLEYIESTGTQYINTNTYVKANTRIELDIALDSASGDQKLFGSYGTGGICLGALNNQWRYGNHNWQGTVGTTTTDRILITVQGSTFTFGETQITGSAISANTQSAMILSAVAYNGTVTDKSSIKIYGLKIYEDTNLVRDFIPVKRRFDNAICLYDKVSGSYFINSGTGLFVAGPVVQGGNA